MSWTCHVVHCVAGRIRLKLPRSRVDRARLCEMARAIELLPEVHAVVANPLTASLLIHHEGPALPVLGALRKAGLALSPTEMGSAPTLGEHGVVNLFATYLLGTGKPAAPPYDLLFLMLAVLAARQAAAGHVMAPAVTLLWYAFQLRRMRETGSAPVSA
jgi:hypothetical protein